MPRERMRDLELPAYMRALVEAREKWMDESSGRLNEHIEHLEWIDKLATALGISVNAEDWWDSTVPAKRTKIMGRISVLRGLRPAQETPPARMQELNAKLAGRERGDDYGELIPRLSEETRVRPAHVAAHDCACKDCVEAETSPVCSGCKALNTRGRLLASGLCTVCEVL